VIYVLAPPGGWRLKQNVYSFKNVSAAVPLLSEANLIAELAKLDPAATVCGFPTIMAFPRSAQG
jgi:hypothetical protein